MQNYAAQLSDIIKSTGKVESARLDFERSAFDAPSLILEAMDVPGMSSKAAVQPTLWDDGAPATLDFAIAQDLASSLNHEPIPPPDLPRDRPGLEQLARTMYPRLNARFFEGKLPPCAIEISERMTRTAGLIRFQDRLIRLSLSYALRYGYHELENTLLHEMVHWWLWVRHRPHGHTEEFRAKLIACGLDNRIHALPMPTPGARYLYVCPSCHRQRYAKRKLRSSCGHCDRIYNPAFRFQLKEILPSGQA